MDIDLRHLRHARALAEHGNFGRAARALRLSQPALSRSIAELERQVGTRLFERGTTGIEPTDMGSLLLERAGELLARSEDLGREMDSLQGRGAGALRIGAGTYTAEMLGGDALAALLRGSPDVQARVVVDNVLNLLPLLRRRELDIVIGDASVITDDPEFHITGLAPRQGYFVCRKRHPLAKQPSLTLKDILAFPLVSTSRLPPRLLGPIVAAARRSASPADVHTAPAITCESLGIMKSIVAGSDAIAILPLTAMVREQASALFTVLPLVEPWLQGKFAIIRLARRTPPPSGEVFVRLLLAKDAELTRVTAAMEARLVADRRPAPAARRRK